MPKPPSSAAVRASTFLCAGAIRLFGTKAQKNRCLTGLLSGETVGALAYSEDQAGTDMAGITATAREDHGTWLLSGTKDIVVNAPMADLFLVLAWHDRPAGPA